MIRETGSKTPRVRFKGFVEPWEQKRLGELYTERNERGNDLLQILSVSIHSGVSNGELDSETLGKQVRRSEDKSLYKHLYAGDLVFNMMRAWQGAIGVAASEGMVSPAYITAVPSEAIYPPFMDFGLRRSQIVAQMNNLSYGVTDFRKRLYWDSFIRVLVNISSVSEQKKITNYLSHLDDLIVLHHRKHDKLVGLKKAMLQKMFPQDGATTPEIRFKGFSDDWELRTLGSLGNTFTGLSGKTKEDFGHGDGRYVPYMSVFSNPTCDESMTSSVVIDSSQNEVQFGDVFFTTSSETPEDVGMSSIWIGRATHTYLNSFCFGFRPTVPIDYRFFAYILRSPSFRKSIAFLAQGISRFNISKRKAMEIEIRIPGPKEQSMIGAYFTSLDELVSRHSTQLEKLKNIKSGCLEKMFV
jgi:type I restriction enzyme S subunit